VQQLKGQDYRYLADETAEFLDHQFVKTCDQDRFASLCNTLRGYEEFVLNTDGIIISSNLEAVNVTGYEEWEVIGKHFSIFYSREDVVLGKPEDDLKSVIEHGKVCYSGSCVKKKGISFLAKIRITVFKDESGLLNGFRLVIKDSTHKALYNYRVKRVRDEYLNLFNNSFIGIFKFRLNDLGIMVLNEKAKELIGVSQTEGLKISELFADADRFSSFLNALTTGDILENCETQVEHRGLWLSVSCRCFPKQGFAEGILIDITDKKKQMAELERLNQEIDKFIYHSSHDMRSPLTTILGLTHLIALEHPSSAIGQYNKMIQAQVNHLDTLLKSLVNITFNKTEPLLEVIDFEKELEVILREFRHTYQQVKVETAVEGTAKFFSDPARLHIILKNLISNSFSFHNPHAATPALKISVDVKNDTTMIRIEDNGIGIDEQCLENIFTMFYKAERGSTGLGLYIVKSMVDKLGGTISVESKRWHGSVFTVQLPNICCIE
jgi:signal transduction histidine kinase